MRRLAAAALLAWINFTLIFAAMIPAVGAGSSLPACCRRAGKHGCAMTHQSTSGPALQTAQCPLFPSAGAMPAQAKANGVANTAATVSAIVSHSAIQLQSEVRYRISYNRSSQKRGPPSFLA
jgi:hypothetical protein